MLRLKIGPLILKSCNRSTPMKSLISKEDICVTTSKGYLVLLLVSTSLAPQSPCLGNIHHMGDPKYCHPSQS